MGEAVLGLLLGHTGQESGAGKTVVQELGVRKATHTLLKPSCPSCTNQMLKMSPTLQESGTEEVTCAVEA